MKNRNYRVITKVNFFFLVFGCLLLLSLIIPAYRKGREILEKHAFTEISGISLQKQLTLEGWTGYTVAFIEGIAANPDLQEHVLQAFDARLSADEKQQNLAGLTATLDVWTQVKNGFEALSVVDARSGVVIASTIAEEVGKDDAHELYFARGKAGTFIQKPYVSQFLKIPVIRISQPVKTPDGQVSAVLAVRIRLEKFDQIVQRGTDPDAGVDVYLVNQGGQVIVRPRSFASARILQDTLTTEPVQRCAQGQSGQILSTNYRGVPVISSFTWLSGYELCLVIEKDRQAAYADIDRFSGTFILAACVAVALALFLSHQFSKTLTRPIYQLLRGVEAFGQGRLDQQVAVGGQDEIGALARAFNQMAARLAGTIAETQKTAEENLRLYQEASDHAREIEADRAIIHKLIDTSSSLILLTDREGRILQYNQAYENLAGCVYGNLPDGQDGGTALLPWCVEIRPGEEFPRRFEEDLATKRGETRRIVWSRDAVLDSTGRVEYTISVGVDITYLTQVEKELRQSERNLRLALAAAPVSIYTTDRALRITFIHDPHPDFCQDDFLGKQIVDFIPGLPGRKIQGIQEAVLASGQAQRGQIYAEVDGQPVYYVYSIDAIRNETGAVVGVACAGYDVTELKHTERALIEITNNLEQTVAERTRELSLSQKILQSMLNALPEAAVLIDGEGRILYANQALSAFFHLPLKDLTGRRVYSFFPQGLAAQWKEKVDSVFASGNPCRFTDQRAGRYFDNTLYPVFDENDQVSSVAVLAMDVTDWKQNQAAIAAGRERLKELARKVVFAQEEERRRISRELHDEAGQALTALGISLKLYYADLPHSHLDERKKIGDAIDLVNHTMEQIRVLAQGLRPQALDALGLNSVLEGFCREFARRTQIDIDYQGQEAPPLPDITSISLYRFVQEALTNIARHSGARNVIVSLSLAGDILTLGIQDDGAGFDLDALTRKTESGGVQGLGLLGMKERIEMIGGKMEINSIPGAGTLLVAQTNIHGEPVERRGRHDPSRNRG